MSNTTNNIKKLKNKVSVTDYGLVGDGVTNNLAALIAMSPLINSNSSWYFPSGTYIVDFTGFVPTTPSTLWAILDLVNKQNVTFFGDGFSSKIVLQNLNTPTTSGASLFKFQGGSKDITIRDIWLDMRPCVGLAAFTASYPRYMGIQSLSCSGLKIRGCKFTSYNPAGSGPTPDGGITFKYKQIPVYAEGSASVENTRGFHFIDNQVGDGVSDMNTYKVFLLSVGDVKIVNNRFLNISGVYPCVRNLVHVANDHLIQGNYFEQIDPNVQDAPNNVIYTDTPSMVWHSNFNGGGGVNVSDNEFNLTGGGGVLLGGGNGLSVSGVVVQGNQFRDRVDLSSFLVAESTNTSCIHFMSDIEVNNFTLSNNKARGVMTRKMFDLQNAVDGSITNNGCDSASAYALKGVALRNTVVSNNRFSDVSLLGSARVGIFVNCTSFLAGETCTVKDNIITGAGGTAIAFISPAGKLSLSGNKISGGITPIQTGLGVFQNDISNGTFTPTIIGTTTAGTATYTSQTGRYQLIGNRCFFQCYITYSSHTGTGNMKIEGLPFTSANTTNVNTAVDVWSNGIALTAASILQGLIIFNSTQVSLYQYVSGGGSASFVPVDAAADISVSGSYEINIV